MGLHPFPVRRDQLSRILWGVGRDSDFPGLDLFQLGDRFVRRRTRGGAAARTVSSVKGVIAADFTRRATLLILARIGARMVNDSHSVTAGGIAHELGVSEERLLPILTRLEIPESSRDPNQAGLQILARAIADPQSANGTA